MNNNLKHALLIWPLRLFYFAHTISMAAMEILGWPLLLFGLITFRRNSVPLEQRKTVAVLLGLCLLWVLSQLIHLPNITLGADQKRILGASSWVLLFWGLFGLMIRIGYQNAIKNIPIILWTLPVSGFYSVYQMFYGWDFIRSKPIEFIVNEYFRATGFFNMPLTFAYVLGFWGAIALGQAAAAKKFSLVQILAIFSGGICVLTSFTRGAWLAYAAVLVCAFFFFSRRQKIFALLITAISVAGFIQNTSLINRVISIKNVTTDQSNSQRLVLWQAHIEIFKDNPVFGVGYGQTENLLPEYYEKIGHAEVKFYSYAHNIYIQALASGGLVGALSLFAVYFFMLWLGWSLYRRKELDVEVRGFGLGSALAQLYFYIGGFTENNFYDGEVLHTLILVWAITLAAYVGAGQTPKSLPSDALHR